jgi:hypothetical protein
MTNFKKIIVGMEVVVIGALSLASWQAAFGGHDGVNWLVGAPLIAVMALEALRIPTAFNLIKAGPITVIMSLAMIIGISVITMEAGTISFENLIFERTRPVAEAERDLDKIMIEQTTIDRDAKAQADTVAKLTADLKAARQHREDIGNQKPELQQVAADKTCYRPGGTKKHPRQIAYNCNSQAQNDTASGNKATQIAHAAELKNASDQVAEAEKRLAEAESVKIGDKATTKAVDAAKQKVADARAMNPMFRVAAAWQKIPVQDLSSEQFEQVKHWAVVALAFAVAFTTTLAAVISSMPERGKGGKLSRMIRARLAAKRKTLRRINERVVTEVKQQTKLVYVPVDVATGKILDPAFQPKPDLRVVS